METENKIHVTFSWEKVQDLVRRDCNDWRKLLASQPGKLNEGFAITHWSETPDVSRRIDIAIEYKIEHWHEGGKGRIDTMRKYLLSDNYLLSLCRDRSIEENSLRSESGQLWMEVSPKKPLIKPVSDQDLFFEFDLVLRGNPDAENA